ncbi:hypothetical protein Poly30_36570 [Planctomycetes bacterium Poly30]|uniref:DUF4382 domain-containing protein n=1 Tax=Saltatorellus ferox TaxID=2528018 RepID=A0A518EVL3_9BACT|nr:hypothetical protein Poly30_36570 [Planctomycetes bacterium Poly30]
MARLFQSLVLLAASLVALLVAGLVGACGETSVTLFPRSSEGPPLSVTYLIEGGAEDRLSSLGVTIQDLRLMTVEDLAAGADGISALPVPVGVELIGLEGRAKLLTTRYYGGGTYTHVRVDFAPGPPDARRHDGVRVDWAEDLPESVLLELDAPFVAQHGDSLAHGLVLSFDPAESIDGPVAPGSFPFSGDGSDGRLVFRPVIRVRTLGAGERVPADDLWGGLLSVSEDERVITVGAEVERTIADRPVVTAVLLQESTLLLQPDGLAAPGLDGLSFDASLATARFLVRGDFISGGPGYQAQMVASSVQLDSLMPASASDAAVVLEARIAGRTVDGRLTVRPIEVERGAALAAPILEGLEDPAAAEVNVALSSMVLTSRGELGDRDDLRIGMRVKLHFASFALEPFEATRVLVQGPPTHRGVLLASQPGQSIAMLRLDADAAALQGGLVATEETPVAVVPSSLFVRLDVEGDPFLFASQLPSGLRAVVRGGISGSPLLPGIESGEVVLRPGRFHGSVTSVQSVDGESGGEFHASVDSIDAPFGGDTVAPPFRVRVAEACVFEGDALTRTEFFERFEQLAPGSRLEVVVSGIGTETPNQVTAYQIRSRVL